jgi:hypothetical protein
MDGGRVAAFGLQYQYIRTLEHLVALLGDSEVSGVRIEGAPLGNGLTDAVDFDVVGLDGAVRLAVQVKSKPGGGRLSAAEAFGVLIGIIQGCDAPSYWLLARGGPGSQGDELAALLAEPVSPSDLRTRLATMLRNAPMRSAQLRELDDELIARLGRCRVFFDQRDDEEIRERLREQLRAYRNEAHAGLGEHAAGLLTGYLVSEILGRAADVTGVRAHFSLDELRALALVDGETLARALGVRYWGVVIGEMPPAPDVERSGLLDGLLAAFEGSPERVTRHATLVGGSGIGKSSLAAAYVAARADAYDVIGWIDCETIHSMLASLERLITALTAVNSHGGAGRNPRDLQHAVQLALGRLPGRWLLVCDNVAAPRELDAWIPRLGRGDVIVTTLNAAGHPGSGQRISVPAMRRDESTDLLRRRLGLDDSAAQRWAPQLDRMAEHLGDWPLALELGAGYLRSCGLGPDQIDHYLHQLKLRSLSDPDSVPPGYPRTLAAALTMCVNQLQARADMDAVLDRPRIASQMFFLACFLASHQIPGHLLLAAVVGDIETADPEHHGPILMAPEIVSLGEPLRELFRFSLARNDQPLPPTIGDNLPDGDRTIAVNTVVQVVVREQIARQPAAHHYIDQLLWHLERWLRAPIEIGTAERVNIMRSHAERLLDHIEELGITSGRVALLYGNLAGSYRVLGQHERAEQLLLRELAHLKKPNGIDPILELQTRFQLAALYLQRRFDGPRKAGLKTTFCDAVFHLEHVLDRIRAFVDDHPHAALRFAVDARMLLGSPGIASAGRPELQRLVAAFRDLESRLPASTYSTKRTELERAERLLQEDKYPEAEHCCRALLAQEPTGTIDSEARRRLIEALTGQAKWAAAQDEVRHWKHDPTAPRLYVHAVLDMILNAGLNCVPAALTSQPDALKVLDELFTWPDIDDVLATATTTERTRVDLLRAINDRGHGRTIPPRQLERLRSADFGESDPTGLGWHLIRNLALIT